MLASACSSGDETNTDKKPATTSKSTQHRDEKAESEAKKIGALPPTELNKAVLSGTTNGFKLKQISEAEVKAGMNMKADKAACQPLASLAGGTTHIAPVSVVHRSLEPVEAKNATVGSMWLASHSEKNAERVMSDLRESLKKCKGFKTLGLAYTSVRRLGDPKLGEEAVSYRITNVVSKQKVPMTFTVVRAKGVIAAFYGVNMLDTKKSAVPEKLIRSQLSRLG